MSIKLNIEMSEELHNELLKTCVLSESDLNIIISKSIVLYNMAVKEKIKGNDLSFTKDGVVVLKVDGI